MYENAMTRHVKPKKILTFIYKYKSF